MPDVQIEGAEQLGRLAKRLKDAGDKGLQRELYAAIARAMKPLRARLPDSARSTLPRRGGLGELVAKSQFRTVRRSGARTAGVRLQAKNPNLQLRKIDDGKVRHPVFAREGRPRVWVVQPVTPGWFTKPAEEDAPLARAEIEHAMQDIAERI